jgi:hypothetical protein
MQSHNSATVKLTIERYRINLRISTQLIEKPRTATSIDYLGIKGI